MTGVAPLLGVLAGVLGAADTVPYVRDILAGRTRPYRWTWLIWAVLAIRRGEGTLGPVERVMLAVAAGGVVGWLIADEPVVATVCVVAADLIGAAMMLPKTYRDPESETLATYALASVAGAFAAGAVGRLDASLLLYPVYFCVANAAIALLIVTRRGQARAAFRPSP